MTAMMRLAPLCMLLLGACTGASPDGATGTRLTSTVQGATTPAPTGSVTTETTAPNDLQRTTVAITAPPGMSRPAGADSCTGSGVYAVLAQGVIVRVVDGSGALVTSVPLGSGRPSGQTSDCTWSAEVTLPTDRGSYRAVIEGWGTSALLSLSDLYRPIVIRPAG